MAPAQLKVHPLVASAVGQLILWRYQQLKVGFLFLVNSRLDNYQIFITNNLVVHTVGLVIGRGGETIKMLQEKSGAKITVVPEGQGEARAGARTVNIIGSDSAIEEAKTLINDIVYSRVLYLTLYRENTIVFTDIDYRDHLGLEEPEVLEAEWEDLVGISRSLR
jgi:hypothetical protein